MNSIYEFKNDYRFLSNFYPSVTCPPTVEHQYQAYKTNDRNVQDWILLAPTPDNAKQRGSQILLRADWEDVKLDIMRRLIMIKFFDKELKEKLIATGSALLTEGNYWHDNYWGECYCKRCVTIIKENHLGLILMSERSKLIADKNQ